MTRQNDFISTNSNLQRKSLLYFLHSYLLTFSTPSTLLLLSPMTPLASFRRWAHTNGIVSKLVPKDSKGMGVGLFVATDLNDPKQENILDQGELLFVPQSLLLARSRVIQFNCSHLQKSLSIIGLSNVSERLAIVLFILSQRLLLEHHAKQYHNSTASITDHHSSSNKDNEQNGYLFADYIATLPDVSTPVTLEPGLVRGYLAGTLLLDSVCAKRSKLEAEFEHLSGILGVFDDWPVRPSMENFIWADATFWSRVLSFKTQTTDNGTSSDADDDMHMVPYLDFANHSADPNIRWEVDSDGLRVWAQESLLQDSENGAAAREVFLSYGNKPNTELLYVLKPTLTLCRHISLLDLGLLFNNTASSTNILYFSPQVPVWIHITEQPN